MFKSADYKEMAFISSIVSVKAVLKEALDTRGIQQSQLYSVLHE